MIATEFTMSLAAGPSQRCSDEEDRSILIVFNTDCSRDPLSSS